MKINRLVICIAVILSTFFIAYSTDLISEKLRLNGKLDSLDLERQARKRLGKNLSELDAEYKKTADTISMLRDQVSRAVESDVISEGDTALKKYDNSVSNKKLTNYEFLFKPVVIVVIALLFFLLVVIFIGGVFKRDKKHKVRKDDLLSNKLSSVREQSSSAPKKFSSGRLVSDTDISIEAIRKNVRGSVSDLDALRKLNGSTVENRSPFESNYGNLPGQSEVDETKEERSSDDIKRMIVEEFSTGVPVAEISKKYKLSYDQVNLIIKLSRER